MTNQESGKGVPPAQGALTRLNPLLLVAVCLLFKTPVVRGQSSRDSTLASYPVQSVFFLDSTHGWATAYSLDGPNFLLRTTDGGRVWKRLDAKPCPFSVFFLSPLVGYGLMISGTPIVAGQLVVASTTDAGTTWTELGTFPTSGIKGKLMVSKFLFTDHLHGWFVGDQSGGLSLVFRTSDGGKTIEKFAALSDKPRLSTRIITDGEGNLWLIGYDWVVYSGDGGNTWEERLSEDHMPGGYRSLALSSGWLLPGGRGWVGGQGGIEGVILATEDYGATWSVVLKTQEANSFRDIFFWDANHGCAVGASTLLYCTTDGGKSWTKRDVLPRLEGRSAYGEGLFTRVLFTENGRRGWVLREIGFLFQTDDGGQTWRRIDLMGLAR